MKKKYIVRLTTNERLELKELVSKGKSAVARIKRANILLMIDADGPNWPDEKTSQVFSCHRNTVYNIRQSFTEKGLEASLERKKRENPPCQPILDGEKEARLIALSCSEPPQGRARWTLELLGEKLVALNIVEKISPSTICRALKKTNCNLIGANVG